MEHAANMRVSVWFVTNKTLIFWYEQYKQVTSMLKSTGYIIPHSEYAVLSLNLKQKPYFLHIVFLCTNLPICKQNEACEEESHASQQLQQPVFKLT